MVATSNQSVQPLHGHWLCLWFSNVNLLPLPSSFRPEPHPRRRWWICCTPSRRPVPIRCQMFEVDTGVRTCRIWPWLALYIIVSIYLSIFLSIYLSVYLSIHLSICLSIHLSFHIYIWLCIIYIYIYVHVLYRYLYQIKIYKYIYIYKVVG